MPATKNKSQDENRKEDTLKKHHIESHHSESHTSTFGGGLEARNKVAAEHKQDNLNKIEEILKDYDGSTIVLAMNISDGKGFPKSTQVFVAGVDNGRAEMILADHLQKEAVDILKDQAIKSGSGAMPDLANLKDLLTMLKKSCDEDESKKS